MFENSCILTSARRNHCRACRFRRCLEVGMSFENIKMGRIPKVVKHKALLKSLELHEQTDNGFDTHNLTLANYNSSNNLINNCVQENNFDSNEPFEVITDIEFGEDFLDFMKSQL